MPFIRESISSARALRFQPQGRCIYCLIGQPPYTKEHIIPKGLGGGLILPAASCRQCQEIIKGVETYCLRHLFLAHRLKSGLVQHLDEIGDDIVVKFDVGSADIGIRLPIAEYPNFLILPEFLNPPGMIHNHPMGAPLSVKHKLWANNQELDRLSIYGKGFVVGNMDWVIFARALAKIAHGLAVAELGTDAFIPLLPEFILGRANDKASWLVGKWPDNEIPDKPIDTFHQVTMADTQWGDKTLLAAHIRLFAHQVDSPSYSVLIGLLTVSRAEADSLRALRKSQAVGRRAYRSCG
jgi:hypothetical protein